MQRLTLIAIAFLTFTALAEWGDIKRPSTLETEQVVIHSPPVWLSETRVRTVTGKIERFLDWDVRKVQVYWYSDTKKFEKASRLGPKVLAATERATQKVHIGPKVTSENFDGVFGHELAHIIVLQKYKQAIPAWLEEGLANYASRPSQVNYRWLITQPEVDVTSLTHPARDKSGFEFHYHASTAVMEMIANKCPIKDLLQLSVGKNLETYLKTFCEIPDLNAEFRKWLVLKVK